MKLGELFTKYGTDKNVNGYTPYYDTIFKNMRDKPIDFLELGIGTLFNNVVGSMKKYCLEGYKQGGSLRAWRDYFPNANIVGFDIQPDTQFTDERITTGLGDSTSKEQLDNFLKDRTFDIILDDGSHFYEHQLAAFKHLWHRVRPFGFYIIEDLVHWSRINLEFLPIIKEIVGDTAYIFHSENKNILFISKNE
jgi:hypothetical protein